MAASQPSSSHQAFDAFQLLILGALLFAGAIIGCVMTLVIHDIKGIPTLDIALWVVEGILYLVLAATFARQAAGAIGGLFLGFVTRLVASTLIALLARKPESIIAFDGQNWMLHAVAIVVTALAFVIVYRPWLSSMAGGTHRSTSAAKTSAPSNAPAKHAPAKSGKNSQFNFNTRPAAPARNVSSSTPYMPGPPLGGVNTGEGEDLPPTHLRPPENFTPVLPREDVIGEVTIPGSIILESVPEAKGLITASTQARIRLAYIVPQLSRGTVWLFWQQVFERGVPSMMGEQVSDGEFRGRWIAIPPRYYVPQVPRDDFTSVKTPPAWMNLPEVPQEAEIKFQ